MSEDQFYPGWVYRDLIEDNFPWESKSSLDLESFLEKYTLHDSNWVGLFLDVAFSQNAILGFQWDSVWLPDEIKVGTSHCDDWPYLFLKISNVEETSTSNFEDIGLTNRTIGNAELLKIDGKTHLAIDDVFGGQVNIVFSGHCSILAMNPDKSVLRF